MPALVADPDARERRPPPVSADSGGRRPRALPWLVAGAAFALYALTVTPGLAWDDAAELAAGVDRLGSVHATGYPLYLLAGRAFVALEPFGSPIVKANLWSALGAAAALGLLAHLVQRRGGSSLGAVVAAIALGGGGIFWQHATAASVYPFFVLAILALVLAAWRFEERSSPARLAWLAGAIGLIAVSHRTGLIFALAGAGFVAWSARGLLRARRAHAIALLAVLVPLASVAYVPLRTASDVYPNTPKLFGMTALQTLNGGTHRVAPEAQLLGAGPAKVARHGVKAAGLVPAQISFAALLLAPLGLMRQRRDRTLLACGVAPALACSLAVLTTPGSFAYWQLPLLTIGALLAGLGVPEAARAARRLGRPARWAAAGALAGALATGPALGAAYVHSHRQDASPWSRAVLASLPPGADVLAPWAAYAPLRATQVLERRRPDVRLVYSTRFLRDPAALRRVREDFLITVSQRPVPVPAGVRLAPAGTAADVQGKGIADLRLGPLPFAEPVQVARVYRVLG